MTQEELEKMVVDLEQEMFTAAEELRFEYAAKLRDEIKEIRRDLMALGDVEEPGRRLDGARKSAKTPALPGSGAQQ